MVNQDFVEIDRLLKPVELGPLSENPLVSVLIANYNYARFVAEAIESVLAQNYKNFEVIVCDDGSTDESFEVVERYVQQDARIKLLRQENAGMSSAQNTAYRASKGEIICLLDADDRYLPEKLKMVVEGFRSRPQSGFLGHQMFRTDEAGRRLGVSPWIAPPPDGWYGSFVIRNGDVPPGLAFGSGFCLRREISSLIFPLPEKLRFNSDIAVIALAPLMTPLIGIPVPLAEYKCHGTNVWNVARVTPESLNRELEMGKILWEIREEYLDRVNPRLRDAFPGFDQRLSTLGSNYTLARLQKTEEALSAYRTLVRSDKFSMLHAWGRWFLRLSILLPLPLFRYAINLTSRPNRLKQWLWWTFKYVPGKARRRIAAS